MSARDAGTAGRPAGGRGKAREGRVRSAAEGAGRGFSLVEILVALVIVGLVGAAVTRVLTSQSEFYGRSDDRTYAQQSLRAGADLFSTELRMASPGNLMAAAPESVSVRHDIVRAVVCDSDDLTGEVSVFVYDSVEGINLDPDVRGYRFSGPHAETWEGWTTSLLSISLGSGQSECESRGAPQGRESWRYRTLGGGLLSGSLDTLPPRGATLVRYGRLTYELAPSGFESGALAIWRNGQELVSPFRDGATFEYVMADGSVETSVDSANLPDVRAVRLAATAVGDRGNRYDVDRPLRLDVRLQD